MKNWGLALCSIPYSAKKITTVKNAVTDEVLQSPFTHFLQKF